MINEQLNVPLQKVIEVAGEKVTNEPLTLDERQ